MKYGLRGCFLIVLNLMSLTIGAESAAPMVTEKSPLYIGIPPSRQPYSYLDAQKQAAGIVVDAIRSACQQMQTSCEFVAGTPDQLLQDLQTVKLNALVVVDAFIAPEVDKLKLTQPICRPQPMFIQKAHAPTRSKPEDFRGTTLGVAEGSIFHIYLLDEYSNQARLKTYPFMDNAIFDLVFGRLDALFAEEALIHARIMDTPLDGYLQFRTTAADEQTLPPTAMRLAVRDLDNDLLKALDTALQATLKEQTCAQLLATHQTKSTKK